MSANKEGSPIHDLRSLLLSQPNFDFFARLELFSKVAGSILVGQLSNFRQPFFYYENGRSLSPGLQYDLL